MIDLHTILQRRGQLRIELDSSHGVKVHLDLDTFVFNHCALRLLDAFYTPRIVGEVLKEITSRCISPSEVTEVLTALLALCNAGVLSAPGQPPFTSEPYPFGGYDSQAVHIAILNDTARKQCFLKAVRNAVRAGDVVLDLGSGSGILAIEAVRSGASKVYAIEPSAMLDTAKACFVANGVNDRVVPLRGWLSEIELPERADVLITDIVGNDPFDMNIIEAISDARDRLLKTNAVTVPRSIRTFVTLVTIPQDFRSQYLIEPKLIRHWEAAYDIDFSHLLDKSDPQCVGVFVRPTEVPVLEELSQAHEIGEAVLLGANPDIRQSTIISCSTGGELNAVLLHYTATLASNIEFSTRAEFGNKSSHWFCPIWILKRPIHVSAGIKIQVAYSRLQGRSQIQVGCP